jgi:type I restriction enzyme S subunit
MTPPEDNARDYSCALACAYKIVHPPRSLLDRFSEIVAPSFRMIQKLHLQTQNLRRTRDLLLPRLLSGQVTLPSN